MLLTVEQIRWCSWGDDRNGRTFIYNGEYYRAIRPASAQYFRDLMQSGLLDRLEEQGLIVKTEISDLQLDGYAFIVHHEKVPIVSYPQEWCFSMLKDAGRHILKLNRMLLEHKHILIDCHPFNILFRGSKPIFVDIGSIVPYEEGNPYQAYQEFVSHYIRPLKLQRNPAMHRVVKALQSDKLSGISNAEFAALTRRVSLSPPITFRGRIIDRYLAQEALRKALEMTPKRSLLHRLLEPIRSLPFFREMSPATKALRHLSKTMESIDIPLPETRWSNYHGDDPLNAIHDINDQSEISLRGRQIVQAIQEIQPRSLIDLAGNLGVFSVAAQKIGVPRVVCTDLDLTALEKLYRHARTADLDILPIYLNIMMPGGGSRELNPSEKSVPSRMRSDVALALAITHHLSLGQRIPFRTIARTLAVYTNRYLLVEFMPFGLGIGRPSPDLPAWYNLDNFVAAFRHYFSDIRICPTNLACNNRVLLICRKKESYACSSPGAGTPAILY